jgi:hypothetical protein
MNKLKKYDPCPSGWNGADMSEEPWGEYINVNELKEWLEYHMRYEEIGTIYSLLLSELE